MKHIKEWNELLERYGGDGTYTLYCSRCLNLMDVLDGYKYIGHNIEDYESMRQQLIAEYFDLG